ncbi:hypothetical protein LAZ67_17002214 [Cordylochernes scorpioides]|uniref:Protein kinase domain-containing protein n=1 Tax=Cordylochernes scorpioides TaxID=51811 RepID=A0ABY6LFZ9_9ARAC|nr:hypothetical protein LAZ67_17002214 [Cordylochernes scorpioides]
MLNKAFPNDAPKRTTVFEWHSRFKAGRISIEVDPPQGRPKFQRTDENVQKITDLIKENPRTTLLELEQDTGISKTTIGRIVTEDLKLKKTPAKFIPRFLTNEQKLCRLATCEDMMEMTRTDPKWKEKIITGDETWVYGYDPETKPQSAEWRDIAPNDFFLFPKLKAVLKGRHFDTRDDIIEKSPLALKSIQKEAYKNCFDNWEIRWRCAIHNKDNSTESHNVNIKEVEFLKQLKHKNIVRFYSIQTRTVRKGLSCMAILEYCPFTLEKVIADPDIDFNYGQKKSIVRQIASALECLVKHSVVHCDLKPANILVSEDGHFKLTDFGLSTTLVKETDYKSTKFNVVTLWYRAPEIFEKKPYSFGIDMWSFGLIITELWFRKPLLPGKDDDDQYNKICELFNPEMIIRLLTRDPDQRMDVSNVLKSNFLNTESPEDDPGLSILPEMFRSYSLEDLTNPYHRSPIIYLKDGFPAPLLSPLESWKANYTQMPISDDSDPIKDPRVILAELPKDSHHQRKEFVENQQKSPISVRQMENSNHSKRNNFNFSFSKKGNNKTLSHPRSPTATRTDHQRYISQPSLQQRVKYLSRSPPQDRYTSIPGEHRNLMRNHEIIWNPQQSIKKMPSKKLHRGHPSEIHPNLSTFQKRKSSASRIWSPSEINDQESILQQSSSRIYTNYFHPISKRSFFQSTLINKNVDNPIDKRHFDSQDNLWNSSRPNSIEEQNDSFNNNTLTSYPSPSVPEKIPSKIPPPLPRRKQKRSKPISTLQKLATSKQTKKSVISFPAKEETRSNSSIYVSDDTSKPYCILT